MEEPVISDPSASAGPPANDGQPDAGDPHAVVLLGGLMLRNILHPEFEDQFLDLLEMYGEDLSDDIVFNEFADYLTGLVARGSDDGLIDRACDALEELCLLSVPNPVDTVHAHVLAILSTGTIERLMSHFGPRTTVLLELGADFM